MFLTNNLLTINNLIVYSKGECTPRIITNSTRNSYKNYNKKHSWIINLPFGNAKKYIELKRDINNKKFILYDEEGEECF